jgi:hypothetical protein
LTAVSFASDPEFAKNTFDIGTGASASSFSANAIAAGFERWLKVW